MKNITREALSPFYFMKGLTFYKKQGALWINRTEVILANQDYFISKVVLLRDDLVLITCSYEVSDFGTSVESYNMIYDASSEDLIRI